MRNCKDVAINKLPSQILIPKMMSLLNGKKGKTGTFKPKPKKKRDRL